MTALLRRSIGTSDCETQGETSPVTSVGKSRLYDIARGGGFGDTGACHGGLGDNMATATVTDVRNVADASGLGQSDNREVSQVKTDDTRASSDGLLSTSYIGLLVTQFLGAVNDNMFRWLVVPIGKDLVGQEKAALALSVGLACFVLPYILLAAPAGYLADRFSKRTVIVSCKVAELLIMMLGIGAVLSGNIYFMFVVVALMGSQSALFGPSKFGSIPEIVDEDKISSANGIMGMTTVLAIVVGTIAGNVLYLQTQPLGQNMWWISAAALIGTAAAGLAASLLIRPLTIANPAKAFPSNPVAQTYRDLATLCASRPLLRAVLGTAVFWALASLAQMNVDLFTITELEMNQMHVGILLALLALGVGLGSVLAGIWSAGKVELGIVPLGAGTIALSSIMLFVVPDGNGSVFSPAYAWSCLWLLGLGFGAGLYDIPLQAFIQHRSKRESRGSILAAANFLTFSAMLCAAGLFWWMRNLAEFSARGIFLALGVATIPVLIYIVWLLPAATVRFIVWLLSRTIYRVKVEGLENLEGCDGALVVANHVSWIDGVLLILNSPQRLRMVVYADYVQRWWIRWLAQDMGAIPIKPGKKSVVQAIRTAREALREGEIVCIFPEGEITRSGKMGEFKPGFLSILKGTGAPVVPVRLGGLWGSIFSFERGKFFWKWPRQVPYPVSITFGRPIAEPDDAGQIRQAVAALGGEEIS